MLRLALPLFLLVPIVAHALPDDENSPPPEDESSIAPGPSVGSDSSSGSDSDPSSESSYGSSSSSNSGSSDSDSAPATAGVPQTVDVSRPWGSSATATVPPQSRTPFSPDASRYGFYLRFGQLWVTDPRFDLVGTDDALSRIEVGVAWSPESLGGIALELGYAFGRTEAPAFQFGDASLALHSIQAAALFRLPTSSATRAFARGLASLDFAHLDLTGDDVAATEFEATALLVGLEGTLGWEILFPLGSVRTDDGRPRRHLSLGLEAGYGFRPIEARFDLERDVDGGARPVPIEREPIGTGDMDLSGWVLRVGGAVRF